MLLSSTRNKKSLTPFYEGIVNCMPSDGGLYIPSQLQDLRRWIMYTDEKTSFQSIAGALTSAFLNEEFSPIICEKISTEAFPFSPELKQLDDSLFMLELYHGFTGCHRDFGVSYLCSCLETMHVMNGGKSVFLDFTHGALGSILANTLKGKQNVKAVILYQKDEIRGLEESDLVWNGGNIYPVEADGLSEAECKQIVREIFSDSDFVAENNLTVANTANFGRLLPQMFFYPFAFSRIKEKVHGDVYYALASGNYSNLVAGLYSWRVALPVGGFILPATPALTTDAQGNAIFLDSVVDVSRRIKRDPCDPSNLERMEEIFSAYSLMLRNFVYPVEVSTEDTDKAAKELYKKYGIYSDRHTARAYAAVKNQENDFTDEEGAIVLVAHDDPALSQSFCLHTLGEAPEMSEKLRKSQSHFSMNRPAIKSAEELRLIIKSLK